ncbi:hypothetical protein BD779DRAFT_1674741 [Infundibulicybe gibba]|nr:hypothetical protein BD779DRAFT_1674741 [Infundibulicybe gibba]
MPSIPIPSESLTSSASPQPAARALWATPFIIAVAIAALLCVCILGLAFRHRTSPFMQHIRRIVWCPRLSSEAATTWPTTKGLSKAEHKPAGASIPLPIAAPIAVPAPTYRLHEPSLPRPEVPPPFHALPSDELLKYLIGEAYTLFPLPPPQTSWSNTNAVRGAKQAQRYPLQRLGVSVNVVGAPASVKMKGTKKMSGKENAVVGLETPSSD